MAAGAALVAMAVFIEGVGKLMDLFCARRGKMRNSWCEKQVLRW